MENLLSIETKVFSFSLWDAFETLFRPSQGCDGCWCYNHHIPPNYPDVLGESARLAFKQLAENEKTYGILAFENGDPAGWCAVDRKTDIPGHDCTFPFETLEPNAIWSIHCFYVRPSSRKKGISRKLLQHAEILIRQQEGKVIEAYPTSPQARVPIFEFCGTYSMFIANGFELVETLPPYYTRLIKKL